MDIKVRYADTQRPAIGLTVESWIGDTLVASKVTDGAGKVTGLEQGLVLKLRRGSLYFSYPLVPLVPGSDGTALIDLQPEHWPPVLQELRQKLGEKSRWSTMARAANQVLKALQNEGTLKRLTNPEQVNERPLGDNPHILIGALLTSLCITRLYRDSQPNEMRAINSALQGLLHWLEHREGLPGYFCRWSSPNESLEIAQNFESAWKAEPSLDEYSGLLLGLRWATMLGTPEISQAANNWLSHISDYLTGTGGWLLTPGRGFDGQALVARGPNILLNAFPLRGILPHYSLQYPLAPEIDDEIIRSSYADLNAIKQLAADNPGNNDYAEFVQRYGETLKPLGEINGIEILLGWLKDMRKIISDFPFIGGKISSILNVPQALVDYVKTVTDEQLWTVYGKALGQPLTVDGWSYNVHIFDRYSLAASWGSPSPLENPQEEMLQLLQPLRDAFNTRATRPIGEDRWGWQLLGVGGRIWFGSDVSTDELVFAFDTNVEYMELHKIEGLPNPRFENVEGFVLGWAITCLALDLDPGIEWASHPEIPSWLSLLLLEEEPSIASWLPLLLLEDEPSVASWLPLLLLDDATIV